MRSDATKVLIAIKPPPPTLATMRPKIITHCDCAIPQIRFPRAKKILLKTSPVRREKMSVRRSERGCRAALAIRYAEASQDRRVKN